MARTKKEQVKFNVSEHGESLKKVLEEAVSIKTKIQLYQDSIKDMRDNCKEEMGLEPKKFNALLKLMFKQSKEEVQAETDELFDLYEQIVDA